MTTTHQTKRHAAQLVFTQSDRLFDQRGELVPGLWTGQLLNARSIDRHTGQMVGRPSYHRPAYICRITGPSTLDVDGLTNLTPGPENQASVRYTLTTQGPHTSSRRHRSFSTLAEAQAAALAWAGRRFYVES